MKKPYIIAEIGFNHAGDLNLAEKMIAIAAENGADAVKFQTYRAFDIALPSASHYNSIQCGEMSLKEHQRLAAFSHKHDLDFLSTPFSSWAIDILEQVNVPTYKIASMDCTNKPLLKLVAQTKKPVILSSGMSSMDEIGESIDFLTSEGCPKVTLLHCQSLYPATAESLNLKAIPLLKEIFNIPVGYSDHYPGPDACILAASLGAEIIESHFTDDTTREGGDHMHSLDGPGLKKLVESIDLQNKMLGTTRGVFQRPDEKYRSSYRRGVYFRNNLPKNHIITEDDLYFSRPFKSTSPNNLGEILGKKLTESVSALDEVMVESLSCKL